MELIDRETLLQKLHDELCHFNDWEGEDEYLGIVTGLGRAIDIVKEEPKVDAVPVVRCKDCKWSQYCNLPFSEDEFCSDGERKEEHG